MNYKGQIQALFQTGEDGNILLALTIIEGGAVTPLEVMPNLHKQYDFLLKHGQVSKVKSDIGKLDVLVSLEELMLSGRNLTTIPSFNLPNLKYLWLNNNELTTIPSFNLPSLEWLRLSYNKLTTMPSCDLPSLKSLRLNNNELITIPSLANLPNLEYLFVRHNELTAPYSHPTAKVYQ